MGGGASEILGQVAGGPDTKEVAAALKRRRRLGILGAVAKVDAIESRLDALLLERTAPVTVSQTPPHQHPSVDVALIRIDQMRDAIAKADARLLALVNRSEDRAGQVEERFKTLADCNAALAASVEALGVKVAEALAAPGKKDETGSWLVIVASATLPIVLVGVGFALARLFGN